MAIVALGVLAAGAALTYFADSLVPLGFAGAAAVLLTGVSTRTSSPIDSLAEGDEEPALARDAGWEALHAELARSRRHERGFVLLAIPAAAWAASAQVAELDAAEGNLDQVGLEQARRVVPLLRTTDHAWADGPTLYVLLSECALDQARSFVERAQAELPDIFGPDSVAYAAFPDDGLTVGALVQGVRVLDQPDLAA
jgi:hypothetical protein